MAFALVLAAAGAPSEPWQSQSLHPEPLRLAAFGPQPLPLYAHSLASGEIRQEDNSSLHTVLRQGVAWVHIPKCASSASVIFPTAMRFDPCCIDSVSHEMPSCFVGEGCDKLMTTEEVEHALGIPAASYFWPPRWSDHSAVDDFAYGAFRGRFAAFFRQPLARAVSSVAFFGAPEGFTPGQGLMRTAGTQVRQLAGQAFGTTCNAVFPICNDTRPAANTPLALERLRDGFAFVGLTDAYALSVCLFHAMHGGECSASNFANTNPTRHTTESMAQRTRFNSSELYAHASEYVDPDDSALFAAAKDRFCADLQAYDVTHETCRQRICPDAADALYARPPSPERPGAELASLCPGRESTVLHYREASRESGSVRQDSNSPTTPHRDA